MISAEDSVAEIRRVVRERRKEVNFTQEELALLTGLSRRMILEFENGKKSLSLDRLLLITSTLGLELKIV